MDYKKSNCYIDADLSALSAGERDLLNLVITRVLCAAAPVHRFETVTVTLDCGGHSFVAKGKTIIESGWKEIDTEFKATLKSKPESDDSVDDGTLPELTESQTFDNVVAVVKEGSTTPPKHFTEDTALSGMETAGAEDMPDDVERRGLGTPATRAAVLEKIIKSGFVERQKKNLIPSDKGKHLIAALPDALTSPKLTAEWEYRLKQVERGELSADEFMRGIEEFTKAIIFENATPKPELVALFNSDEPQSEPLGTCPRCGAPVREAAKGFFCDTRTCGFKLWKESRFWTAKKKTLSATIVGILLKDGKIELTDLYSGKTGKTYDATVILVDTDDGYVNFKLDFGRIAR